MSLPSGLNHFFMVLMPKVPGSDSLSDFKPISLINGIYKLITKVLAGSSSNVLPNLISHWQHTFVRERNNHDCSLLATKIMHYINIRQAKAFLLKLDFRKAFDSVS